MGSSHQLASSPGHSKILSHSCGEKSVHHGCRIKSRSSLGTRLATNYALDEEVMKTLSRCLEKTFIETRQYRRRKLINVRLWYKTRGETGNSLVEVERGSYTAMYIYTLLFTQPQLQLIYQNLIWEQEHTR